MLDQAEALDALETSGIRTARIKYVDSAEDAVAFSARRTARDQRFVPINLRIDAPGMVMEGPLQDEHAIRRAYEKLAAYGTAYRILAQIAVEPGTDVVIDAHTDDALGKVIELRGLTHGSKHVLPIDEAGARELVEHYRAFGHHGKSERERLMLEHLLVRVAEFYENSGAQEVRLDPVRLHGGSYTVLGASIGASGKLRLRARHAGHDPKGSQSKRQRPHDHPGA